MTREEKVKDDERTKNEIIAFVEQSIHRGGGTYTDTLDALEKWLKAKGKLDTDE